VIENGHRRYTKARLPSGEFHILGRGAYGTVYKYEKASRHHGRPAKSKAIKFIFLSSVTTANDAIREATRLSKVQHPNLVRCTDQFVVQESRWSDYQLCIVMDLVSGGDLCTLLARMHNDDEHFNELEVLRILQQIVEVLEHLHSKEIMHRDLKPENVFIDENSRTPQGAMHIKVGDLGLAYKSEQRRKAFHVHQKWQSPTPKRRVAAYRASMEPPPGTCGYIAPELWAGAALDFPIDLWSSGILLFDMASTGRDVMSVIESSGVEIYEWERRWGDPALLFDRQSRACEDEEVASTSRQYNTSSPRGRNRAESGPDLALPARPRLRSAGDSSPRSSQKKGVARRTPEALTAMTGVERVKDMKAVCDLLERTLRVDPAERIKAATLREAVEKAIETQINPPATIDMMNMTWDPAAMRNSADLRESTSMRGSATSTTNPLQLKRSRTTGSMRRSIDLRKSTSMQAAEDSNLLEHSPKSLGQLQEEPVSTSGGSPLRLVKSGSF